MKTYSTKEAARQAEIHWVTLLRWHAKGKVSRVGRNRNGWRQTWRWTARDIVKIKRYKKEHFREVRDEVKRKEEITYE